MLFPNLFCLVASPKNGRRWTGHQPDWSCPSRTGGTGWTSLLCDDRYRPV